MRTRAWLPACLLACSTPAAWTEWRAAAYLGGARTERSSLAIEQAALATRILFRGVDFDGQSFQTPLYYGYRAGYFFGRRFGAEAEFIHQKVFARVDRAVETEGELRGEPLSGRIPMERVVRRFSISHGLNLLLANLVVCHPLLEQPGEKHARLLIAGRFGAGGTIPHPESNILGAAREQYQGGRPAIQVAAGVEFRLWRGLYGLAEYKFTRTRQRVDIAGGTAEALFRSHHAVFGLAYHF